MATNDRTTAPTSTATLDFDPDALRDRYRAERDKAAPPRRQRPVRQRGRRTRSLPDRPYVEDDAERPPLRDDVEVVIVGGGFGGLLAGARLREAGFDDLRLIEKGGDVGGTWYWNRYPGAMCDVESYVYPPARGDGCGAE
ncbi:MAG: NAD(P)-binding protein [Acidimicrobiales bacterium]